MIRSFAPSSSVWTNPRRLPLHRASGGGRVWPFSSYSSLSFSSSSACDRLDDGPRRQKPLPRRCEVRRCLSATAAPAPAAASPHGMFLWVGARDGDDNGNGNGNTEGGSGRLLLPVARASEATIFTPQDVLEAVNAHYDAAGGRDEQFVGGMGEDDGGVWFATPLGGPGDNDSLDALDFVESVVREGIALVKEVRHGVPFGLYTSGLPTTTTWAMDNGGLAGLRLASLQVSLFAANPMDYQRATGREARDFGKLCAFIAQAVEEGVAVEASVLEEYKGSARDLALSLGARQVHVLKG